ncbi:hypothetical protein A7U59_08260 [Burkholderia pseudomallei]|nr:hypothetical protein A7U59_08260 [Burkholderia pseudomallei]
MRSPAHRAKQRAPARDAKPPCSRRRTKRRARARRRPPASPPRRKAESRAESRTERASNVGRTESNRTDPNRIKGRGAARPGAQTARALATSRPQAPDPITVRPVRALEPRQARGRFAR